MKPYVLLFFILYVLPIFPKIVDIVPCIYPKLQIYTKIISTIGWKKKFKIVWN